MGVLFHPEFYYLLLILSITDIAFLTIREVQEPHPQPPPRLRGGGYDIPDMIRKRDKMPVISCPDN